MLLDAAKWVARMDAGNWTGDDEAALQVWLDGDPLRRGALLEAEAAWLTPDVDGAAVQSGRAAIAGGRFGRRGMMVMGSVLAASLVAGVTWLGRGATYGTAFGEVRRVPLADGSVATVNSDSKIEVTLEEHQRNVRIARGEAWFEVAKDPGRPFLVEAGRVRVQAVGTAFSVSREPTGARILVSEGVVDAWAAEADGHKVRLTAGESAFVADNAAIRIDRAGPSSVDRALAWRGGMIDLSGQTLQQAIEGFNRYNRRKLVLVDQRIASERFDGIFQLSDPEGFAIAIHDSLAVPVDTSEMNEIKIGHAPN